MDLLGRPLLIALSVLTVAVPALAVRYWARVRGPRMARVISRLAMVVTAQVVAICLVAAAINDYGYFYSSWSEVAGGIAQLTGLGSTTNTPAGHVRQPGHGGFAPASAGQISARSYVGFSTPSQWRTRGRLESVSIGGALSGLHSHAFIYLPPQYFQPEYAHTYFPAAEVLTGYPGFDQYLISRLKYQSVELRLLGKHEMRPLVLVMMRPSVTFPRDTECTDVPGGPQAETFFASDVPEQIVGGYRVLSSGWGAIGDSTGGYCATKLAMLNPDLFSAAAELSGYFFALRDHTTGDLWGGSKVIRDQNDLHWRLRHLPAPPVSVLVGTSRTELGPDGYDEAMGFVRQVKAPMTVQVMSVPRGGHNTATWSAELPSALSWLSGKLPPPGASPALVQLPGQRSPEATPPPPKHGR